MTTQLSGVLKRELAINSELYTLSLSEEGFTLTLKGRRKGLDIRWADLVGGDAALATALNASLTANIAPRATTVEKPRDEPKPAARPKIEPAAALREREKRPARTKTKMRRPASSRRR